ncbi:MAG: type II toxin-antitoxin system RelE/ParE family toxin [Candidatus Kapaibacteriales bacterium]
MKTRNKIFFNIRLAQVHNDPMLFKKLNKNIWEFRTKYQGKQIRLLAFWDKTEKTNTLVIATNGFIKKSQKTPVNQIEKAERIRIDYFESKSKNI